MHPDSVLFISLDSCRYDTFAASSAHGLKAVGPLHKAQAPGHFTYGSHASMFVGFTPGVATAAEGLINPKFSRLFRLNYAGHPGAADPGFLLSGVDIVDGFRNAGYRTVGTAAMGWFDPATPVSATLRQGFDAFYFSGNDGVASQTQWVDARLAEVGHAPAFVFINVGETHVPYHHAGAPWSADDNPCKPFQTVDRSEDCRHRQTACLNYADSVLTDLLERFSSATTLVCADHGDCWGEDGLWEHGIAHEMTLTVPLLIRYRGRSV